MLTIAARQLCPKVESIMQRTIGESPPLKRERRRDARFIIADGHELPRIGLRSALGGEPGLTIVGEATSGREAIALCRRKRPDLALLDVSLPDMSGLLVTKLIRQDSPRTRVLIVTSRADPNSLFDAVKAGAAGYVLKESSRAALVDAVRAVLAGKSQWEADLAAEVLHRLADAAGQQETPGGNWPPPSDEQPAAAPALTSRELDVLALLVRGATNPEIAAALDVAMGTVKVHVEHIMRKLNASDRTQAAVRAIGLGLVAPEEPDQPDQEPL